MSIKLTTIVPVYEGMYVRECLNSLLLEFDKDKSLSKLFDFIIVSDGADSDTVDTLHNYEERYENLKVIECAHKGASAARNVGIKNATGEYITFMDADDRMCENFFSKIKDMIDNKYDLYIFGIKRYEGRAVKNWLLNDRLYASNHEFADEYIVNHNLLVYSNVNKFYKTKILHDNNIYFNENYSFGEDRLLNLQYLKLCKTIYTSSIVKFEYIKRSDFSQSTKYHKNFFDLALNLHKEKLKCLYDLSRSTTLEDKINYAMYDIGKLFRHTIERFEINPEEEKENIPRMNKMIFEESDDFSDDIGIILVLGSRNCGYKIEKAIELSKGKNHIKFILSGGNLYKTGDVTEAEYMASELKKNGIDNSRIFIENKAVNTIQNLENSKVIIDELLKTDDYCKRIGIVASGFHLKRVKILAKKVFENKYKISYFAAYSQKTSPDKWYKLEDGKDVIIGDFLKVIKYNFDEYLKFIYS